MSQPGIRIVLNFNADDQAWIRRERIAVPDFWGHHAVPPMQGDVLRIGGRQFVVEARVWEHDGDGTVLRLFVGGAHAQSDTVFG